MGNVAYFAEMTKHLVKIENQSR